VGARLGHARSHVRVERQEALAHQQLAVADRRQRDLFLAEAVGGDVAGGAPGKHDLKGVGHGSGLSMQSYCREPCRESRAVRSPWAMRAGTSAATTGLAWKATPRPAAFSIGRSLAASATAVASPACQARSSPRRAR